MRQTFGFDQVSKQTGFAKSAKAQRLGYTAHIHVRRPSGQLRCSKSAILPILSNPAGSIRVSKQQNKKATARVAFLFLWLGD
jgi:hypothetical protein